MAIWMVRHGETEWSISGRHTGSTDIPLTPEGRLQATAIGKLLAGRRFDRVLSSPMLRARETAGLAGFGDRIRLHEGLLEYDYGELEGLTTGQIRAIHPGWQLFRDGCPGGETPEQMAKRVDALIEELRELGGNSLLFGHGHCLRSLAVRLLDLPIRYATSLLMDAGSISIAWDGRDGPAIALWNRRVEPRAMVVADIASSIARTAP
ncbi:MAG TPA: histidine phosphatase family protein [Actinomycetota bacterium]|nr:histidine phosphatase family protein [Actinomycetota bacterium]